MRSTSRAGTTVKSAAPTFSGCSSADRQRRSITRMKLKWPRKPRRHSRPGGDRSDLQNAWLRCPGRKDSVSRGRRAGGQSISGFERPQSCVATFAAFGQELSRSTGGFPVSWSGKAAAATPASPAAPRALRGTDSLQCESSPAPPAAGVDPPMRARRRVASPGAAVFAPLTPRPALSAGARWRGAAHRAPRQGGVRGGRDRT